VTTGLVISGAGARGAYEAGLLSVVLPRLLVDDPDERLVIVGTSAGAINTVLLSAQHDLADGIDAMLEFWLSASVDQVARSIWLTGPGDVARYLAMVAAIVPASFDSILDSSPLQATLDSCVNWRTLDEVLLGSATVSSAAVVATASEQGSTVAFVEGVDPVPQDDPTRNLRYARTSLRSEHVVASSAIPVLFRPACVTTPPAFTGWYYDGGVRLNTPIKPALELGVERVVVVATTPDPDLPVPADRVATRPDVFDSAASVLRATLVDHLTEDVRNLRRVNALLVAAEDPTYRTVPNLYLGPPTGDLIAAVANEVFDATYGALGRSLTTLGIFGRLMGSTPTPARGDLLSFVLFDEAFHRPLIELGTQHAEQLLEGGTPWQ
jgi:NTE family protein